MQKVKESVQLMSVRDPLQCHPWRSMRGVGLLRLYRKHMGRIPVISVKLCPGHMALRLSKDEDPDCHQSFTVVFDLLPEITSSLKPSHKDILLFYNQLHEDDIPTLPFMLVISHQNVCFDGFMGPKFASSSSKRRFISIDIVGEAHIWEYTNYTWRLLQKFRVHEGIHPKEARICMSGHMIYWTQVEQDVSSVKARPISFESDNTVVVGFESTLLKVHRVMALLGLGSIMVILIQKLPSDPLTVCFSDRSGALAMPEIETHWKVEASELSAYPVEASIDTNTCVKLFPKLMNSELVVLETGATSWRVIVFTPLKPEIQCSIRQSSNVTCCDFQPTSHLALALTSTYAAVKLQGFDRRTGICMLQMDLASAHYRLVSSPSPFIVFAVSDTQDMHVISLPKQRSDLDHFMRQVQTQVIDGQELSVELPPQLDAMLALDHEQRLTSEIRLEDISKPLSSTAACRSALLSQRLGEETPELASKLLSSVLSYLRQEYRRMRSNVPCEVAEATPDFLLSINSDRTTASHDHFEITCRLLYHHHPELFCIYVRTVKDAEEKRQGTFSFPYRALRAIPPTPSTTPQLLAHAALLCLCKEIPAAIALLSTSWEMKLKFVDTLDLFTEDKEVFKQLLHGVETDDQLLEMLKRCPHILTDSETSSAVLGIIFKDRPDIPAPLLNSVYIALGKLTEVRS